MTAIMSPIDSLAVGARYSPKLRMKAGDGVDSYARNSHPQGDFMSRLLPTMFDVLDRVILPQQGVIAVADLGCSSGPNAIKNIDTIIHRLEARFIDTEGRDHEFQAFFQDLPGSDFNTLFRLLSSEQKSVLRSSAGKAEAVPYFTAGVPGSFYGRLFPAASIHFAMSSFALHWMSKIPEAVFDKKSPAYNGGHTELHLSSISTINAYAEQADQDLSSFLAARAVELARGGSMLLVFGIRESYFPYRIGPIIELQEKIWNDLVLEGIVEPELRDSHNNFVYYRTLSEVDKVLASFSSLFTVVKRDLCLSPLSSSFSVNPASSAEETAQRITSTIIGAGGSLLEDHFGRLTTKLFRTRYKEALVEGFANKTLVESMSSGRQHLVLVLSRK